VLKRDDSESGFNERLNNYIQEKE